MKGEKMKKLFLTVIIISAMLFSGCESSGSSSKFIGEPDISLEEQRQIIAEAMAMQTGSGYNADEYHVIKLKKDAMIYGMMPGQSSWYTDRDSVIESRFSYIAMYEGLQIAPHPVYGYRTQLSTYRVVEDINVAEGKCLANRFVDTDMGPVYLGEGGYTQYIIPDFTEKLERVETISLYKQEYE